MGPNENAAPNDEAIKSKQPEAQVEMTKSAPQMVLTNQ